MIRTLSRILLSAVAIGGLAFGQSVSVSEKPVQKSGAEQNAKIVKKVRPAYPAEAKAAGIQGTVRMEVVIAKDGTAKDITVMSGPKELSPGAVEAVRQWQWQPTNVDGSPVEVVTEIEVNFKLDK